MHRRRCFFIPLTLSLLWLMASGVGAASEDPLGPHSSLPSRIPLLDESGLDKFSRPLTKEPSENAIEAEYPPDTLIPIDTENLRYFSYFAKIQRRIEQSQYYPKEAANDLLNGIVAVSIEIRRDGSLGGVKVIGSSGKEILDETAIEIIQKAAPFPTIPQRIQHTPLKVAAHIRFIPTQEAVQKQQGLGLSIPLR